MDYQNSMEDYYYWLQSNISSSTSVQGYCERYRSTPSSFVAANAAANASQHHNNMSSSSSFNQFSSNFDEDIFGLLNDQDLAFLAPYYDDHPLPLLPTSSSPTSSRHYSVSSSGEESFSDAKSPMLSDATSPQSNWTPPSFVDDSVNHMEDNSPASSDLEMKSVESLTSASESHYDDMPVILTSEAALEKMETQKPIDDDPTKCSVCKEAAGKHSYYGGRVCPSCRAFFRRAVQSKYFEIFFCSRGGEQCDITLNTRRSCQYCRFKKCLEAGMRIAWVLPDGERQRRFDKFQKSTVHNKFNQFLPATENKVALPLIKVPSMKLTLEEKATLKTMNEKFGCLSKIGLLKSLEGNQEHMYNIIRVSYSDARIPYDSWKYMYEACQNYTKVQLMTEMTELPLEDRTSLIDNNAHAMLTLKTAAYLGEEGLGLASVLPEALESGKYPIISKVLNDFSLSPERPKHVGYEQVFISPWAPSFEMEERHKYLFQKMKKWALATEEYPNLRVDETLIHLMRYIIAFTPDFIPLTRRDLCEQFVLNHTMLLNRYLKEFYPKTGAKKFAESFSISSYAREATQIYNQRLPV